VRVTSASPAQPWCRPGTRSSCQPPKAAPQHRARPPKLGADKYEDDPELEKIRKDRNYSWVDVITIYKDKLPNYEEKIKMFCEVHWHLDVEIRYVLDGSGCFDGFFGSTLDENYVKVMRLFVGEPVWVAQSQLADQFEARGQYTGCWHRQQSQCPGASHTPVPLVKVPNVVAAGNMSFSPCFYVVGLRLVVSGPVSAHAFSSN
ncbi:hypothetical protein E2I00_010385, partial [Balaenoptera physalus]